MRGIRLLLCTALAILVIPYVNPAHACVVPAGEGGASLPLQEPNTFVGVLQVAPAWPNALEVTSTRGATVVDLDSSVQIDGAFGAIVYVIEGQTTPADLSTVNGVCTSDCIGLARSKPSACDSATNFIQFLAVADPVPSVVTDGVAFMFITNAGQTTPDLNTNTGDDAGNGIKLTQREPSACGFDIYCDGSHSGTYTSYPIDNPNFDSTVARSYAAASGSSDTEVDKNCL